MDWKDIAADVSKSAPLLGGLLGGPVGLAVTTAGSLIASAFGVEATPEAVAKAMLDPASQVTLAGIEKDRQIALATLATTAANNQLVAETAQIAAKTAADAEALKTVNATMQVEDNTRKFSWRDYWGYVAGTAFGFVVLVIGYLVVSAVWNSKPELMAPIPAIVGAFTMLFGIASAVLGVPNAITSYHAGVVDRITAGEQRSVNVSTKAPVTVNKTATTGPVAE